MLLALPLPEKLKNFLLSLACALSLQNTCKSEKNLKVLAFILIDAKIEELQAIFKN